MFERIDLNNFWDNSHIKYGKDQNIDCPLTDELLLEIETEIGYKLPKSYIFLMKQQNGGIPFNTCFPTNTPTGWADDHIAITSIAGIGRSKPYSICGELGTKFMIDEWDYPDIGVAICDCPSAGHELVFLDYRDCGSDGEPTVVYVDQEDDFSIIHLADTFEDFICGLVSEDEFED